MKPKKHMDTRKKTGFPNIEINVNDFIAAMIGKIFNLLKIVSVNHNIRYADESVCRRKDF